MANNTLTFVTIKGLFDEAVGDALEFDPTTNIAASKLIISTTLNQYDDGVDDFFNGWWAEITEGNNIGAVRKIDDYATSGGQLTVFGANFSADSSAMTVRLHRYNPARKDRALKRAIDTIYPQLHKPVDNQTLITGNLIPDGHFETWTSTSALTHWSATNITQLQTSTSGLIRGGKYSAKATASAANGYIYVTSDTFPRLLDLGGHSVSAYAWAYPEVADDATIVIYTKQADGTEQTLTSTTTCPAGEWTMLKLEDQTINEDLVDFQMRLKTTTNAKYVYWDDALLTGIDVGEYYLPDDFYEGQVLRVHVQATGVSTPPCYDLNPFIYNQGYSVFFNVINDGTYKLLKLEDAVSSKYRIRLIGDKPLETPAAFTTTITIDTHRVEFLLAKARMIFWAREVTPISAKEREKYEYEYAKASRDYSQMLLTKAMPRYSIKRKGA